MAARFDRRNRNAEQSSEVDEGRTQVYRLLGHIERPIGTDGADERLQRAARDRHALAACARPQTHVVDDLEQVPNAPAYETTRVPCGMPVRRSQSHHDSGCVLYHRDRQR